MEKTSFESPAFRAQPLMIETSFRTKVATTPKLHGVSLDEKEISNRSSYSSEFRFLQCFILLHMRTQFSRHQAIRFLFCCTALFLFLHDGLGNLIYAHNKSYFIQLDVTEKVRMMFVYMYRAHSSVVRN
jgi:hypothetical protein